VLILALSLISSGLTFVDDSLSTGQYYKSAYDKDFFYPWLRNILQYSLHYVILVLKFALLKLVCVAWLSAGSDSFNDISHDTTGKTNCSSSV
jgi:hypothetical protein